MMPTVLRRSGPDFEKNGQMQTPRAMIHFCEVCGAENAPFLISTGGKLLSYCGWNGKEPVCNHKEAGAGGGSGGA